MTDFIPKGFIGLPNAIWFLANRLQPDLWKTGWQDVEELNYWSYLRETNDAKWVEDRLRYPFFRKKMPMPAATSLRLDSYYDAENRLRQALYANDLKAYFVSDVPDTSGELQHVLPQGWGTDAGQEILWFGRADLAGEPTTRIVFVDVYSLLTHFFPGEKAPGEGAASVPPAELDRAATPRGRGRPHGYDWTRAREVILAKLAYHGLPDANDPDLSSQAVLERVAAEFVSTADRSPAESVTRGHVTRWIAEFAAGARPENEAGK
jgi:hypothetical protein